METLLTTAEVAAASRQPEKGPLSRHGSGTSVERSSDEIDAILSTPEELSGLLNSALDGLTRIENRGHLDLPETVLAAMSEYRNNLDSVSGFVDERCVVEHNARVSAPILYENYRAWAQASGRSAVSAQRFRKQLLSAFPTIERNKSNGTWYYTGIRVALSLAA